MGDGPPLTLAMEDQEFQGTRGFHLPAMRGPQGLGHLLSQYQGWGPKRAPGHPTSFPAPHAPGSWIFSPHLSPRAPALPDLHTFAFRPSRPSFPQITMSFSLQSAPSQRLQTSCGRGAKGYAGRALSPGLPTSSCNQPGSFPP